MQGNGIVLGVREHPVFHVESGLVLKSLMVATIYPQLPHRLVLTREILTPNATGATVSYTVISGDTLEDWKRNWDAQDLMIWNPLPDQRNGQGRN